MPKKLLGLLLILISLPAFARDKTEPDFLRNKHAGTARLHSAEPLADVYPKLLKATEACWVGVVDPMTTGGVAPFSAWRAVYGEQAPDGQSAWIAVRAKGMWGALQSNFLQVDLLAMPDGGTQVDVYYKNNVKGQRLFVTEVEYRLKGDLEYCGDNRGMIRTPGE